MSDDSLIDAVSRVWVEGGGDADGLCFCMAKIILSVENKLAIRAAENELLKRYNQDKADNDEDES